MYSIPFEKKLEISLCLAYVLRKFNLKKRTETLESRLQSRDWTSINQSLSSREAVLTGRYLEPIAHGGQIDSIVLQPRYGTVTSRTANVLCLIQKPRITFLSQTPPPVNIWPSSSCEIYLHPKLYPSVCIRNISTYNFLTHVHINAGVSILSFITFFISTYVFPWRLESINSRHIDLHISYTQYLYLLLFIQLNRSLLPTQIDCYYYYYYYHHHHHLLYAGYLYSYSWGKLCP